MSKITITEALAEIKTIDKRLAKKREHVMNHIYRQEMLKDPFQKDGGSVVMIERQMQAVGDLEERKVAIRRAIQVANGKVEITVGGRTRTVADWLVWRREVAPGLQLFLGEINSRLARVRQQAMQKGVAVVAGEGQKPEDIIVNVNEGQLAEGIESLETVLGTLDGLLSLKNATVTIDLD